MSLDDLASLLKKEGIVSDEDSAPTNFLDTGVPHLNYILSGDPTKGLASGRIAEIRGESSSGKTMLATRLMISAQQQGGFAGFWDHERSYDSRLSIKQGMSTDKNKFLFRKGSAFEISLVESIKIARLIRENKLIPDTAPIVFIYDSFASMVPLSKLEKDADEYKMNDTTALARAASAVLPAFTNKVDDYNVLAVFLNQLADTMDMYGPKKKSKGGNSLPFYASYRLTLSGTEVKDKGVLIKKEMKAFTTKNKLYKPHQTVNMDFVFNSDGSGDFDVVNSYVDYLKDIGAIVSAGAYVKWNGANVFMKDVKKELASQPDGGLQMLRDLHNSYLGM